MLFKNVFRTLKKQYVLLLLLGVIIVLSSLIYTSMDYAIKGVLDPTETFFEEYNQEDYAISVTDSVMPEDVVVITNECSVPEIPLSLSLLKEMDSTCYYEVLHHRLDILETEYPDLELEIREYKDIYFDHKDTSYYMRVLKDMDEINKSYIYKGTKPSNDDEIAFSETFALKNELDLGDKITILEKEYTVTAYVLFPDYNLMMLTDTFNFDNETQTIALTTDSEFTSMYGLTYYEIAGTKTISDSEFEDKVIDDFRDNEEVYFVTNIVLTINNVRSGAIYSELAGGQAMGVGISMLISLIALMIVAIMVSKVLNTQRGPIGILKSMGYKNSQIALPYIVFISILSLPAIFLGYYLGYLSAEPFKSVFMQIYLLPSNPVEQSPITLFVAVILPFVFTVGLSYLIIIRMLRKKPVELLNPIVSSSANKINQIMAKPVSKMKIVPKLRHLLIYRNIVKFLVFLLGMFYAAFLIYLSLGMNGVFDRIVLDYYDNTSHEYIGYCNPYIECEHDTEDEIVIEVPGLIDDEEVMIVGLDKDNDLHPILNSRGNNIITDLEDGIIITESFKLISGLRVGDLVTVEIGDKESDFKIIGTTEEYSGKKVYVLRTDISQVLFDNDDYFNAVYSVNELSTDDYLIVLSTEDIMSQIENMQGFFNTMVIMIVIVSSVIGGIIIYILTVLSVEDNFYNISLFKVLGYNDNEINKMVLGGYLLYGLIIFIVAIPITLVSFYAMEIIFAQMFDLIFPLNLEIWHVALALIVYLVIFLLASSIATRNLKKISLQEAMKMYQV